MSPKYINPYSFIAANYSDGMDAIAAVLAPLYPNQTIDDVVNAVYAYVATTYLDSSATPPVPPRLLFEQSLKSLIYSIVNGFLNIQSGEYLLYTPEQMEFINRLMETTLACGNPEDMPQNISNIEDEITRSNLTTAEQMPLLYATAVGQAAYTYWVNVLNTPPAASNWTNFITSFAPGIVKFPYWIAASMQGTLLGISLYDSKYNSNPQMNGQLSAALQMVLDLAGGNIILALFGCLSVGSGKVALNLQPRGFSPVC